MDRVFLLVYSVFILAIPFVSDSKSRWVVLSIAMVVAMFLMSLFVTTSASQKRGGTKHLYLVIFLFSLLIVPSGYHATFGRLEDIRYLVILIINPMILYVSYKAFMLYSDKEKGRVLGVSAVILSILVVLEGFSIISIGNETLVGRELFGVRLPFRKATGLPMSDGKLGILLIPMFYFMTFNFLNAVSARKKITYFAFASLILLAILVAQSRSGWLALVVSGIVVIGLRYRRPIERATLAFMVLLLGTAGFLYGVFDFLIKGIVSEGIYRENVFGRFDFLLFTFERFLDSPIVGGGHAGLFLKTETGAAQVVHNLFLDVLASYGVLGFIPFLLGWIFVGKGLLSSVSQKLKYNEDKIIAQWLVVCFISLMVELSLYRGFYNEYTFIYIGFILAFSQGRIKVSKGNTRRRSAIDNVSFPS